MARLYQFEEFVEAVEVLRECLLDGQLDLALLEAVTEPRIGLGVSTTSSIAIAMSSSRLKKSTSARLPPEMRRGSVGPATRRIAMPNPSGSSVLSFRDQGAA
jgi:hypothetical protein